MSDGMKKIKLPDHLKLDSVSPATRLLEKRRLMYEMQKAFEDQKEEFNLQEKRFKIQEAELREKDILIQDNLIKYSTYLQNKQALRQKEELNNEKEQQKIRDIQEEIELKKILLENYKSKADKITAKCLEMREYGQYLEKVLASHSDEFQGVDDILSRSKQLEEKNVELRAKTLQYTNDYEQANKELNMTKSQMEIQKTMINNEITTLSEKLDGIYKKKSEQLARRDEQMRLKSNKITETGQILMTINNLFQKCFNISDIAPTRTSEETEAEKKKFIFDDTEEAGKRAEKQLERIKACLLNFGEFYKDMSDKIADSQGLKSESKKNLKK